MASGSGLCYPGKAGELLLAEHGDLLCILPGGIWAFVIGGVVLRVPNRSS